MLAAMMIVGVGANQLASAQPWAENFDGMATGSACAPQFGWDVWDGAAAANSLIAAGGLSAPNRINVTGTSDTIRTYTGATAGKWRYTAMQFVPSTSVGDTYFILLNKYAHFGPYNWSVQLRCNAGTGVCQSDLTGAAGPSVPLTTNAWVQIRCDVNLTADTLKTYYNGLLVETVAWKRGNAAATAEIKCVDLYAAAATSQAYYDNMRLDPVQTINLSCALEGCVDPTGTQVVVELRSPGNLTPLESHTVTLDGAGAAVIETILAGTYDVAIKGSHYLRDTQGSVVISTSTSVSSTQLNGDVDWDNEIAIGDFSQLSSAFGSVPGDGNWNPEADLDCDLEVSIGDYGLLSANFGMVGDD